MQLVIITGLSGSGKSIALKALEDSGFYCIDNLPASLLLQIPHHLEAENNGQSRVAISMDMRSAGLESLPDNIVSLKNLSINAQVLFLDASEATLVKRYSETRRSHPLSDAFTTLSESIARERDVLEPLAAIGHRIDTSELSANSLRTWVKEFVSHTASHDTKHHLTLLFESFGFKNGIPLDADFVFDVRSLPNPFYDVRLKALTGRDQPVIDFLANDTMVKAMRDDIQGFVAKWLPSFLQDNRSYLTVAIGCTGGQHRSVYLVETLAQFFKTSGQKVLIRHRQLT